ncbi:unnamed protein product [Sphenostylis stenocarpa]|uniref:Uncharacterized protein n=1 Tax=Sphenostylis stenocarpa TaxID=92480 RepID=A0AA86VPE8_9FABA|nr:unnamed protein product [Sphenostylis stenocarpa]
MEIKEVRLREEKTRYRREVRNRGREGETLGTVDVRKRRGIPEGGRGFASSLWSTRERPERKEEQKFLLCPKDVSGKRQQRKFSLFA